MSNIDTLFAAMLTRNSDDSGTDSSVVLIANSQGIDRVQYTFPDTSQNDQGQGQANLYEVSLFDNSGLDTSLLAQMYFRVGIRGGDAWRPEHFFLWGISSKDPFPFRPLAMVFNASTVNVVHQRGGNSTEDLNPEQVLLSTDNEEGDLSFPLLPISLGDSAMPIKRLLIIMTTADQDDAGTDSTVKLQITSGEKLLVDFEFPDTPQDEQEQGQANLYFCKVTDPFVKNSLDVDNAISLIIEGDDAWLPSSFFIFGLDTEDGMATQAVPLVHIATWTLGNLSTDSSEGNSPVPLRIILP